LFPQRCDLNRKIAFLDGCVAPCGSHQLGFCQHTTGRTNQCLEQLQTFAAHNNWPALPEEPSALCVEDEWPESEVRGHARTVVGFAKFRNISDLDSRLLWASSRIYGP
jgi:hypothetical protein